MDINSNQIYIIINSLAMQQLKLGGDAKKELKILLL